MKKQSSVKTLKLSFEIKGENKEHIISMFKMNQQLLSKASNEAITYFYNFEKCNEILSDKFSEKIKDKDLYGITVGPYVERLMKDTLNIFNTKNVSQARMFVQSIYNNNKEDVFQGNQSLSNFKSDIPIIISSDNYELKSDGGKYSVSLSLFNKKYMMDNNVSQLNIKVRNINKYQKAIISRISCTKEYNKQIKSLTEKIRKRNLIKSDTEELNNQLTDLVNMKEMTIKNGQAYEYGFAQICEDKKGKWCIFISYYIPKKNKIIELNQNKVLGIDLGVVNTLTYQVYDSDTKEYTEFNKNENIIGSGEITTYLNKLNMRKASIISSKKLPGEGRVSHGRRALYKPITDIGDKHARYMDTYNHKLSKKVIEIAKKYGCGVIQIENLSGIKKNKNKFLRIILKDWSYYDLQLKVKYKADLEGIEVKEINPFYTSQRCSECGHIHKESRKTQSEFVCVNCGYKDNADVNASKNIAVPDIDIIIENYLSEKRKENEQRKAQQNTQIIA